MINQQRILWKDPPIKTGLGITTNSFEQPLRRGDITLEALLQYFAKKGFSWVELRDQQVEMLPEDCKRVQTIAQQLGLHIHYAWNNDDIYIHGSNFDKAMQNAATFGPDTYCRIVIAPKLLEDKFGYTQKDLELIVPVLQRLIEKAQTLGLRLCFENSMEPIKEYKGHWGMEELFRLVPRLQSTFDAANMTSQVKESGITTQDLVAYYLQNKSHIPYFHLKTSRGRCAPAPYIGEKGDFELGKLLRAFEPSMLICLELPAQPCLEDVRVNVEKSLAFLKEGGYIDV